VNARHEFVLAALEPNANLAELCRAAGISRKTAYKWLRRFRERGVIGLEDMSKRPRGSALKASGEVVMRVLELRGNHPRWGPRKLRVVVARGLAPEEVPSERTVARILERAGEIRTRRRPPSKPSLSKVPPDNRAGAPNEIWTVDFKGWWNAKDGARCEPLTVRDAHTRFVLKAKLMTDTGTEPVRAEFLELFEQRGLPQAIQVDNGPPFGSTQARLGMTTLSAWWVALGIRVIRGRPAHPQDNGAHERMHLDMRYDVEDLSAENVKRQQAALDAWRVEFNEVRPHEAIGMKVPADLYASSSKRYSGPRKALYPATMCTRKVTDSGRVRYRGQMLRIGQGYRGYEIGIESLTDPKVVRVHFYELDLGEFILPV